MKHTLRLAALLAMTCAGVCGYTASASAQATASGFSETETMPTMWIEEMTWTEIQSAMNFGYTNIIIPAAGIEQNGPHMPLNKHRHVVRANANTIARQLGNTLIAPVIDFVPEGNIESREGHMAYAGTISMPNKVFADIVEYTIRSLSKHGFKQFFIIGDSGSSQLAQEQVAKSLQRDGLAVFHIGDYYANPRQEEWLRKQGYDANVIGGHSGLRDTSELLGVAPREVRDYQLGVIPQSSETQYGAWGDTSKASAQLGYGLAKIKVDYATAQICRLAQQKPNNCWR
jgi:creatinine amidohydrolase